MLLLGANAIVSLVATLRYWEHSRDAALTSLASAILCGLGLFIAWRKGLPSAEK